MLPSVASSVYGLDAAAGGIIISTGYIAAIVLNIVIGILAGMSAQAIGRNPDAAGQIRGIAIILAAFAEGLGVLAIVVGLLAIFIKPAA